MLEFLIGCLCGFVATMVILIMYESLWGGDKHE